MDQKSILLQYWKAAAETEGWYPPYKDALEGVNMALANWRPEGKAANTIWETVAHVTYFKERLERRLRGEEDLPLPKGNDETFIVQGNTEQDWHNAVAQLFRVHHQLQEDLKKMNDDTLDQPMPEEPVGTQFWDLITHDAYHTGQIIFIRKLAGAWPERRSFL